VASPEWLKVVQTDPALIAPRPKPAAGLQIADVACIELAERHAGCALLMDDRAAKLEANRRGIVTIGTLSLLFHAGERGMLDFEDALTRLERTTFRASLTLRAHYRQQWENRVRTN